MSRQANGEFARVIRLRWIFFEIVSALLSACSPGEGSALTANLASLGHPLHYPKTHHR